MKVVMVLKWIGYGVKYGIVNRCALLWPSNMTSYMDALLYCRQIRRGCVLRLCAGVKHDFLHYWYRNVFWIRVGGVSRFSVKTFLSHSAEKFCRGTLYCVTNSRYRKTLCSRGLCHDLYRFFLSRSTEELCRGTLLCCVPENFR